MELAYIVRSEQYANIANEAYKKYVSFKKSLNDMNDSPQIFQCDSPLSKLAFEKTILDDMSNAAIVALIFEALAVESYVNLMGLHFMGSELFFECYERTSTHKKLDAICKHIAGKTLPDKFRNMVIALFNKRDYFVHQKPKLYRLYEHGDFPKYDICFNQLDCFLNALEQECSYPYSGIENDMKIYDELKKQVQLLRNSDYELLEEIKHNI